MPEKKSKEEIFFFLQNLFYGFLKAVQNRGSKKVPFENSLKTFWTDVYVL